MGLYMQCNNMALHFAFFTPDGELVSKGNMQVTPFEYPEYEKTGAFYTFETFDMFKDHFIATYIARGRLMFLVFDAEGRFKNHVGLAFKHPDVDSEDLLYIRDMDIVQRDGKNYLFMIMLAPVGVVVKIEFKDRFFIP